MRARRSKRAESAIGSQSKSQRTSTRQLERTVTRGTKSRLHGLWPLVTMVCYSYPLLAITPTHFLRIVVGMTISLHLPGLKRHRLNANMLKSFNCFVPDFTIVTLVTRPVVRSMSNRYSPSLSTCSHFMCSQSCECGLPSGNRGDGAKSASRTHTIFGYRTPLASVA